MESDKQDYIDKLIASFIQHEPPFSSLGTPFLVDTETTEALVRFGRAAIPALEAALESGNPKIVMYAAYCLGQIGDQTVLPSLQSVEERYANKEPKEKYDYSVLSAVGRAIERLQEPKEKTESESN